MSDQPTNQRGRFQVSFKVGGQRYQIKASVAAEPMRLVDLVPLLQSFDDALIEAAIENVQRQGKTITCRAGCGTCCRQLVPISQTEARYLAELVAVMPEDQRAEVEQKFDQALASLDQHGMLDRLRAAAGLTEHDASYQLAEDYFKLQVPCPFLQDQSCSIYPHRPLTCREFLVTSPAENCSGRVPAKVDKVPLPAKLTQVLYRFGDGKGRDAVRWLPLAIALEWVAQQGTSTQGLMSGAEMFKGFVQQVVDSASLSQG